ncbi:hypothetical protein, partial [Actinomadura roseirufa]|uniref:hypothetical protein n=1 Tax=Actinomadura roseirufa TaxID=2094049 RepID=UPI001A9560C7
DGRTAGTEGTRAGTGGAGHAVRLTGSQRAAIADYGEHGRALLRAVSRGDADALFRVAVLLGTDAPRRPEAAALLIEAAADGHPAALDLLDAGPDGPDPREAARIACELGETAAGQGAADTALAYFTAAVRGGRLDAAYEITEILEETGRAGAAGRRARGRSAT